MSDQEQHEIAGRMMAEYIAIKRTLAALNSKAADYASTLRRVAENLAVDLSDPLHTHYSRSLSGKSWLEWFDKYPAREDIAAVASEIEATTKQKAALLKSLQEIGFEPKD